ncbi:MAPEG family protein [Amycolatopsis jejuensis]|uniref:MAPEG family protein n=1 Tax=Amycolatopsis jejuensis TaxID=330084 RepID=UPI000527F652|nr:MAPEG family protein [Amycolatopsis jejuensis]
MTLALICAAVLAALVFLLGANVTRLRAAGAKTGAPFAPDDPADPLYKAIRAHGNAIEYIPTLLVLFVLDAARAPAWTLVFVIGATLARLAHAAGMLTTPTLAVPTPLRVAGASGTYLFGVALVVTLVSTL